MSLMRSRITGIVIADDASKESFVLSLSSSCQRNISEPRTQLTLEFSSLPTHIPTNKMSDMKKAIHFGGGNIGRGK